MVSGGPEMRGPEGGARLFDVKKARAGLSCWCDPSSNRMKSPFSIQQIPRNQPQEGGGDRRGGGGDGTSCEPGAILQA